MIVQDPLVMAQSRSLPEPDLAVVRKVARDRRPDDAVLVVEVSVSSRSTDLGRKAAIYAAAEFPGYWVLDVEGRALLAHLEPRGTAATRWSPGTTSTRRSRLRLWR